MIDRDFIDLQEAVAGDYSLERELGRGGMGIVYLAREVQLDRYVAIKVLPTALAIQPDVRERFLREARLSASLSHPHIVPIYRVGEARGFVFFAMGYVNGETLGDRLRSRGPLPPSATTRLLREVAWALSYAHSHGIVHRDIKPDNILIETETGRALVSDFGIAQGLNETSYDVEVAGTARYMSPEQAVGDPLDGRSDFYSLGVVGYLSLSGRLPIDAPTLSEFLVKQQHENITPLAPLAPSAPAALVRAIERCLGKRADDRFGSGEELAEALDAAAAVPTRARIPLGLRVWAQARDPLVPLYLAWSAIFTTAFLAELRDIFPSNLGLFASLALLPLLPMTAFRLRKAYQVLSAGYTLRDLRVALSNWERERREERDLDDDNEESTLAQFLRVATIASLTGLGLMFFLGVPHGLIGKLMAVSGVSVSALSLVISNVLGVRIIPKALRKTRLGGIRSWLWNSPPGEWLAKMLTPKKTKQSADLAYRPTEMALGVAAIDLYRALPRAYRDDLPELPQIVERLESHAGAARARIEELDTIAASAGGEAQASQFAEIRELAKRELADAVSALEALRLDLLRLHSGDSDLHPITTVLQAARELGDQLDRLAEAQREVDEVQKPLGIDLRFHTPT
ncbi:MAG TPA: serine/threonine-protein kinase [Gemmatimonadaceae bacterium]